jgi:hypothetical protein
VFGVKLLPPDGSGTKLMVSQVGECGGCLHHP